MALQSQLLTSLPVSSEWNANSAIMATVWFWRYPLCWQGIICILLQSQARSLGHCWVDKSHQGIYTAKGPLRPHRNHTPCVLGTDKGDWVEGVTGGCLGKKEKKSTNRFGKCSRQTAAISNANSCWLLRNTAHSPPQNFLPFKLPEQAGWVRVKRAEESE